MFPQGKVKGVTKGSKYKLYVEQAEALFITVVSITIIIIIIITIISVTTISYYY